MRTKICTLLLAAASATAQNDPFLGNWANVDANTGGLTRLSITANQAGPAVHGFGKCQPSDCDWGTTPLALLGYSAADNNPTRALAVWDTGFSSMYAILHFDGSYLVTEVYTVFKDNSGRSSFRSLNLLKPDTTSSNPSGLAAPQQLQPPDGSVFSNFPRTTALSWTTVDAAATYGVEIDCFQCCQANRWCTDVGGPSLIQEGLARPAYTFDWVGAQPGRWRVWARDASGNKGAVTGWWGFTYTQ